MWKSLDPDQTQQSSGLIWVQIVCKGYWQTTLVEKELFGLKISRSNFLGFTQLTHLCRMYFPILINWTSPFPISGLLGGIFHFYSNFKRNVCKQTVENLIRHHILLRLIWFCTVCRCPTKKTVGLYGLNINKENFLFWFFLYKFIVQCMIIIVGSILLFGQHQNCTSNLGAGAVIFVFLKWSSGNLLQKECVNSCLQH